MKLPLIRTASKHGQQLMRFTATEETGDKPGAGFLLGCPLTSALQRMKSDHLNQYRPWQGRQDQEVQVASHLEEGNHPERGLHRLHLRVLRQQHVLNS